MINSPVVTVVIPTYNHAGFLSDALRSLCAQTYAHWEAVVVNNYSEDDTISVVESFADPRIRLENFRNNGVIAASRNRGIALASGRYIAFLDSDDTWYPEKLTRCMKLFNDEVGLVCHGLHWIGDQDRDIYGGPSQRATFDGLLDHGSCLTPSATIIKKEYLDAVGNFSEAREIITAEDYHLWLKLAQAQIKMIFLREILGEYRVHSSNQSGSAVKHMNAVLCVVDEFFKNIKPDGLRLRFRINRRYGNAHYGAGRSLQRNKQYIPSCRMYIAAMRYHPFFLKTYAALAMVLATWIGTAVG
jgi:glycosyltransferase involved in cell wall biosynthesis